MTKRAIKEIKPKDWGDGIEAWKVFYTDGYRDYFSILDTKALKLHDELAVYQHLLKKGRIT